MFAPLSTYFDRGDGSILGRFVENERGKLFEYSENRQNNAPPWGLPHLVWVTEPIEGLDSGFRYAIVKKTVAYIAIDEDAEGQPIMEKWQIKQHKRYTKD